MNDFLKEKELLLDSIENNTPEHWKNYYKDVPIECIYDDLVIDINEIKRLQQENQQLKEQRDKAIEKVDILRKAYERNISPIPCTEIEIIDKVLKGEDNNEI